MDKKLNRQIGYRPGKSVSETLEDKANIQPTKLKIDKSDLKPEIKPKVKIHTDLSKRTESLYNWLKMRPMLNLNGLCLKVGIDRANFVKGMSKDKELKEGVLVKLETELKQYGYAG